MDEISKPFDNAVCCPSSFFRSSRPTHRANCRRPEPIHVSGTDLKKIKKENMKEKYYLDHETQIAVDNNCQNATKASSFVSFVRLLTCFTADSLTKHSCGKWFVGDYSTQSFYWEMTSESPFQELPRYSHEQLFHGGVSCWFNAIFRPSIKSAI